MTALKLAYLAWSFCWCSRCCTWIDIKVHKRRPQSGRRGFVQCGHFSDKGALQMWTSELFGAKILEFSKFMVCPHGQVGGVEPVWIFFGQRGEEVNFSRFFAASFMENPICMKQKAVR